METSPNSEKSQGKQHWYQSSPSPTLETPRTSHDHDNKARAATKIQAGYHGYKVRKGTKKSSQEGQSRSKGQEGTEKVVKVCAPCYFFCPFVLWSVKGRMMV